MFLSILKVRIFPISFFVLLMSVSMSASASSKGGSSGASVSPTRLIIAADKRSGSITLSNTASVELAYRMTVVEMGISSTGRFMELADSEIPKAHKSALPYVRFSPRQVRLKPGESQVVRVIVRRGAFKSAGEYRSHLKLRALPVLSENINHNLSGTHVLEQASASINVGITIPLIIRHQKTDATVVLNSAILKTDGNGMYKTASLAMGLDGNRSAYGDFTVYLVNGRSETLIGRMKSFALYYPYKKQTVNVPLRRGVNPGLVRDDSKVRVIFSNNSIDSARPYWVDETVLVSHD